MNIVRKKVTKCQNMLRNFRTCHDVCFFVVPFPSAPCGFCRQILDPPTDFFKKKESHQKKRLLLFTEPLTPWKERKNAQKTREIEKRKKYKKKQGEGGSEMVAQIGMLAFLFGLPRTRTPRGVNDDVEEKIYALPSGTSKSKATNIEAKCKRGQSGCCLVFCSEVHESGRAALKGTNLRGRTPICGFVQVPVIFCGCL